MKNVYRPNLRHPLPSRRRRAVGREYRSSVLPVEIAEMSTPVYKFDLPIYIHFGSKKISLNLNWYRNAHFMILNRTKQEYFPMIIEPFRADRIHIHYCLIWNSKRRTDLMNWITVADKYFVDWLVGMGYIPDDCIKHYPSISIDSKVDTSASESYIHAEVTVLE